VGLGFGVIVAILNTVELSDADGVRRTFRNRSVSFRSSPGANSSSGQPIVQVPEDRHWIVQSARFCNGDQATVNCGVVVADADGTAHGLLSNSGAFVLLATGEAMGWTGGLLVPAGWRLIGMILDGASGGGVCNWQYTAIEIA
jgi:hypothetical protein